MEWHPIVLALAESDMEASAILESERNKEFAEDFLNLFAEVQDGCPF